MLIRAIGILIVATVLIPACSSNSKPKELPPQTMAPEAPMMDEPVSNAPQEEGPGSVSNDDLYDDEESQRDLQGDENFEPRDEGPEGAITVVIEPATEEDETTNSLFAASQRERQRREEVGESSITVTNQTLKEHSKGGLTVLEEEPESEEGEVEGEEDSLLESAWEQEQYWRARVLEQREAWREALDSIDGLEREIATLRRNFYAEDDPFYRDSQIKPAWDNAIDELDDARETALLSQQEVEDTIEEGHRAGALPGWLREGIELEPTEEELARYKVEESEFIEPSEPVIADEGQDGR